MNRRVAKSNSGRWMVSSAIAGTLLAATLWAAWFWSRPPVVARDNLRYLQLLRTACSSRRTDYVEGVEKSLQHQRSQQQISDSEWNHFVRILADAKAGRWERAERATISLETAQLSRAR
jgi:CRISPR/Cas system-associated exonuclease Cas4 (RecB family)